MLKDMQRLMFADQCDEQKTAAEVFFRVTGDCGMYKNNNRRESEN